MKTNISKELNEAIESKGQGIVIPVLDPKDLQVKMSAVVHPSYLDAIECDRRWSERFKKQCADVVEAHKDVLDFEDKDRVEGNKPVVADKPVKIADGKLTEDLKKATPYMLRNDGELLDVTPIHPYIKYGHESAEVALNKLATTRFSSLEWFYTNTNSEDTRQLVRVIAKYLLTKGKIAEVDFCDLTEDIPVIDSREVDGYLQELNDNTNQEFCRVRTSGLIFGGTSNEIYFRISSVGFNWFDLIWELVYKYRAAISDVTICKDSNTFGGRFDPYKINGQPVNHLPVNEFLTCSGNPVVESVPSKTEAINEATKAFSAGKLVSEAYDRQLHPTHIHSFYETQVSERLNEELDHLLVKTKPQSLTEALYGMNEIEQFVKMAKAIGLKTMGDVKDFLDREGEGKDILTALYDYLHDEIGDLEFQAKDESLKEGYLDNIKNPDYWQNQVDYQIEKFGRVGGGLIQDLDEAGFYLDTDNKVQLKTKNESLNESVSQSDKDIILDIVKGKYETGHGYLEDKRDYEEALDRELSDGEYKQLEDFYNELIDLGPSGFYEEYKDKLEFDPDFVAEFGEPEGESEEFEDESEDEFEDKFPSYTIYCENQFGKYPVCSDWRAVDAKTAVRDFTELNSRYRGIGKLSAEKNLKEALVEAAGELAEESAEVKEEPEAVVKIDLEKFKPWGNAVDTYNQIKEAGKMYDFEKMLEEGWPDGIEDATLNGLLAEDRDFISQMIDLEFKDEAAPEGEDK